MRSPRLLTHGSGAALAKRNRPRSVRRLRGLRQRAWGVEPFGLSAEGGSHLEAVTKLEELIRKKLANGVRLDSIKLPEVHPLMSYAGVLDPNDPMTQEYLQAVAEYRRQRDEEDANGS